jgi:hypothetical protein
VDSYEVSYVDTEGDRQVIEVEGEDEADAEDAARGELSAEHPSVDTDDWEILGVRPSAPAPSR